MQHCAGNKQEEGREKWQADRRKSTGKRSSGGDDNSLLLYCLPHYFPSTFYLTGEQFLVAPRTCKLTQIISFSLFWTVYFLTLPRLLYVIYLFIRLCLLSYQPPPQPSRHSPICHISYKTLSMIPSAPFSCLVLPS